MKTNSLMLTLIGSLALAPACGKDDEAAASAAVPSDDMLSLQLDSTQSTAALTNEPSMADAIAQQLMAELDDARALLHTRLDELRREGDSKTRTIGGLSCTIWTLTRDTVAYRLTVCEGGAQEPGHHSFTLHGRPADSRLERDYVLLVAGRGAALASLNGERRGRGVIGYDFDAWSALRGSGPVGKVAIGYRVAGRARTLDVGYRNFAPEAGSETRSARLFYHHVIGVGGRVAFGTGGDLIAPGETAGTYVFGQDGLAERVRLALAWARGVGARVSGIACGGTAGLGCVSLVQCYDRDGSVSFEDARSGTAAAFDENACPAVAFDASVVPSDADLTAPVGDNTGEVPGPTVSEPEPTADE